MYLVIVLTHLDPQLETSDISLPSLIDAFGTECVLVSLTAELNFSKV